MFERRTAAKAGQLISHVRNDLLEARDGVSNFKCLRSHDSQYTLAQVFRKSGLSASTRASPRVGSSRNLSGCVLAIDRDNSREHGWPKIAHECGFETAAI